MSPVDYSDVQGIVRFGHAHMKEGCYLLLKVKNPSVVRSWLATAPVTTGVKTDPSPNTALQVAFSRQGLEALNVPAHVIGGFSSDAIPGMDPAENPPITCA